jgi:transketolase N-terminal domain/subunit
VIVRLEVALVRAFGWSLVDIDNTIIESLLAFIRQINAAGSPTAAPARTTCDQVSWL